MRCQFCGAEDCVVQEELVDSPYEPTCCKAQKEYQEYLSEMGLLDADHLERLAATE